MKQENQSDQMCPKNSFVYQKIQFKATVFKHKEMKEDIKIYLYFLWEGHSLL